VERASRSSGLLHLGGSWARVSQTNLKTGRGAVQIVHMASSWRSRGVEAEDRRVNATSCVGPFYPNFAVFIVLGPRSNLVF
jgi:hypothetical protein